MLSLIPGWLRSRLLVDVSSDTRDFVNYIAVHEYTQSNGLEGPAHRELAEGTPRHKGHAQVLESISRSYGRL
jgi:hypothetical protein